MYLVDRAVGFGEHYNWTAGNRRKRVLLHPLTDSFTCVVLGKNVRRWYHVSVSEDLTGRITVLTAPALVIMVLLHLRLFPNIGIIHLGFFLSLISFWTRPGCFSGNPQG